MSLHFNPLNDDVSMLNYMALYLSIKGYVPKGTNKRKYPSAKDALRMLDVKNTKKKNGEDIRWND